MTQTTDLVAPHIEQTPMLCESCLRLYENTHQHCPTCADEPLLDVSRDDVRQMLRDLDKQRFFKAARRYLLVSIVFVGVIYAVTLGLLGLIIGELFLYLVANQIGMGVILISYVFCCLFMEKRLMKRRPPKSIAAVWGEAPMEMTLTTEQITNGITQKY